MVALTASILLVVGALWGAVRAGGAAWVAVPVVVMFGLLVALMKAVFKVLGEPEGVRATRAPAFSIHLRRPLRPRHLGHHPA